MFNKEKILEIVDTVLSEEKELFTDKDIFITEIKVSADNKITVNIDSLTGINISDCAILSRGIGNKIDRDKEDFELVVSSAGLDQTFKVLKQYEKNIGKEVKILSLEGKRYKGILTDVSENEITLTQIKKNKKQKNKTSEEIIRFDPKDIKEAKVVITF